MGAPDDYNTIHCHKCGEAEDPSQYDDAIGYRLIDHDECFHCFFEEHDYVTLERKPTPKPMSNQKAYREAVRIVELERGSDDAEMMYVNETAIRQLRRVLYEGIGTVETDRLIAAVRFHAQKREAA